MAAKGGSQPSVSSDDVLMDLSDEEEQSWKEQWVEQHIIEALEAARDSALAKEAKAAAPKENENKQGADKLRVSEDVRKKVEEEQMRMEQWVEQHMIEAAETARDSALAKEAKAAAPTETAYNQGADKWHVSEDVRKKFEAVKRSMGKERADEVRKSVQTKTHDKNVTEKTSSESDSDLFDRVLRIKKTRWREEGGSQPSCGAAAVSRERSHDQDGASHKRQKTGCSPLLSPRCPRDISPYMS